MRQRICLMLLTLSFALSTACGKDRDGQVAEQPAATPQRIVSLTPSATGILEELGALDRLVGRDKFSESPESIRSLPVVGDFATPNVEAIAALAPDLVLLDESQKKAKRALDALGLRCLVLRMHNLEDVANGLRAIGHAVGKSTQAEAHIAALEATYSEIRTKAAVRKRQPRVLLIIDRAPDSLRSMSAAGQGSYLDELLALAGGINVMASSAVLYPQLGAEQVLRTAPDIIIDVSHAQGSIDAYQVAREVPAVANGRVHIVDDASLRAPSTKAAHALGLLFELTAM